MAAKDFISQLRLWRSGYRAAWTIAVFGMVLSVIAYYLISTLDRRLADAELSARAVANRTILQRVIDEYPGAARSLADLLSYGGNAIDFASFTSYTEDLRARHIGISAFAWAPRVLDKDRAAFEAKARATVRPDYQIVDNALSGTPTRAPEREQYFPNLYYTVEPGFEHVAGSDGLADPLPAALYRAAIDTGEQQSVGPIPVIRIGDKDIWGYLLFTPVYQWNLPHDTLAERRQNIKGMAIGVIRIQETLAKIASSLGSKTAMSLYFFNPNGQVDNRLLYWHPGAAAAPVPQESTLRAGLYEEATLKIANSSLGVLLVPEDASGTSLFDSRAPRILVFGLIVTAIVTYFAAMTTRRRIQLEKVSKELETTASDLRFGNALLTAATETSLDGILVADEAGRTALFNKPFLEITRLPAELVETRDDARMARWFADQLVDEQAFIDQVQYLYAHRELRSHDRLVMKDGRRIDRDTAPLVGSDGRYLGRIWFFRDITARVEAEQAQEYRGELLHALAAAAAELLATRSLDEAVPKAIAIIGEALHAVRILVVESTPPSPGAPPALRYAWRSPHADIPATAENLLGGLQAAGIEPRDFEAPLRAGKIVAVTRASPGKAAAMLDYWHLGAVLIVPIQTEGELWGFIGFDDVKDREWTSIETDILKTLADLIGTGIARARHVEMMAATSRELRFSNTLFKATSETSPDGILVVGTESRYDLFNHQFLELMQIPAEIASARDNAAMIRYAAAKTTNEAAFIARIDYLKTHSAAAFNEELSLKDGRTLEYSTTALHSEDGADLGRVWFVRDITERRRSEESQRYRSELMHSLAVAGRALLADADLDVSVPKALGLVAEAIGADQAVVIEEIEASQGGLPFAFRFSWNGPGVMVGLDENAVRGCADLMPQLGRVFAPLRQGKAVNLNLANPDGGRALLERLQIDSFVVLPVTVEGAYWGQVGFNAVARRAWSAAEIDIGSTLADLIGASITRERHVSELAAADAIIERSPVILYRLDAKPPFPMTYVSRNVAQLGFDAADFLRSPAAFRQMFDPEDLARIGGHLAMLTQHWESGAPNLWHMRRADGSHCWYENQLFPIFAGDGKLQAIEGVAVNVDERVRADAALRRYNDLLGAVTQSVATLLTESSLANAVPLALAHVGQCIGEHRILVFQRPSEPASEPYNDLRFKWTSDDAPILSFAEIITPEAKPEVMAWFAPLGQGKIVTASQDTASEEIRKILAQIGATSLLLVPVFVDGLWWGHLSFEVRGARGAWEETEIALFRTLANLIGAAIARERHLQELADANRIVENSPTLLYRALAEPNLPFVYISQNVKRFGFTAEQLLADPSHIRRIHPEDAERVWQWNQAICSGAQQSATIEFRIQLPDGSYRWVENHGQAIKDDAGRVVAVEGILVDIDEHKKAEETIAALARTDALTGLANRRTFLERLDQAFGATKRGASRFAVLSLDLDHFKEINDTLGHPMGDLLLQGVAARLRSAVRETDVVARFGGDEFMVLQADVDDPAAAGTLAEKIRAMIAAPLLIEGNTLHVTASIGIITYAPEIADGETMIAQADIALYRAKEEGRDRYRFHSDEMNSDVRERMALVEELHEGLTRQEFELHYQPLVELATGRVVGMEALLRWNHPRRGRLLPGVFLPAAERAGLIVPLGHWIFEEACRQLRTWRQAGLAPLPMTVNVSVAQLKSGDLFARDLEKILQKYDIEPKNIELDIREGVLGGMTQAQITALQELHKLGVRLAIDDFGGELSSLGYVQKYNVSHLKISRSVVQMAVNDSGSAAAVKAINDFAVDLGVGVVVEGVETKDQRAVLMSIAPHTTAQGFLFSRPLDAAAATEILRGDGLGTETPDAGFASLQQGAA